MTRTERIALEEIQTLLHWATEHARLNPKCAERHADFNAGPGFELTFYETPLGVDTRVKCLFCSNFGHAISNGERF